MTPIVNSISDKFALSTASFCKRQTDIVVFLFFLRSILFQKHAWFVIIHSDLANFGKLGRYFDRSLFSSDCLKISSFDLISCNLFPMFGSLNSKSTKKHKTAGICSSCLTIQLILSAPSGKYKSKFSFFRLQTGYDWSNGTKVKFTGALWLFYVSFLETGRRNPLYCLRNIPGSERVMNTLVNRILSDVKTGKVD